MATVTTLAYKDVKTVMTKSSLPVGGYSVNPYVGCPWEDFPLIHMWAVRTLADIVTPLL